MTSSVCEIHKSHSPRNLTLESHHIVPRAWQATWHPADDQRILWAPRTIELCPTGHRNVHLILVELMKQAQVATAPDDATRLETATHLVKQLHGQRAEFPLACQAPQLWISKGGQLMALFAAKQYGYGIVGAPPVDEQHE